ncbi:MAG: Uma2 family endonuclease [Geitlerinemataceae cyanobacterium]
MVQQLSSEFLSEIIYPDSDGQPMSDNTKQFRWIVLIKENLEILFANDPNVFVAGDLLWYPVQGENKIRQAPDVMVVFEILLPGNRAGKMAEKLLFYQRYGVEEYYIYDPDDNELVGLSRSGDWLERIETIDSWVSPRLGIRFALTETLEIYRSDKERFLTSVELAQLREQEKQRAEEAIAKIEVEKQRYNALVEKLRQQGIELE